MKKLTMTVSNLLVKKCIRELSDLAEKHLPNAQCRVNPVWKVGRKTTKLDNEKTIRNLKRYLNKFAVAYTVHTIVNNDECGLACRIVTVVNNQLSVVLVTVNYDFELSAAPLKVMMQTTNVTISRHALARWMYRNESDDYKAGLKVLLGSLVYEDRKLARMAIDDGLHAVGSCERQVLCSDGGISIIAMKDPSEEDYDIMDWTLITYLDPSLIMEWNKVAVNSDYSNIQDIVGDKF